MDNKKIAIIVAVVAVLLLGGLGGFFLLRDSEDSPENTNQEESSSYIIWSQAAFEQNANKQRWLYFHAEWCPECRSLDKDIKANVSEIPEGVVIFKIEYDDYQNLRQRYKVLRQTTVVSVDAQGEKVKEVLAVTSKNNLAGVIEALYVAPASDAGTDTNENDSGEMETSAPSNTAPSGGEDTQEVSQGASAANDTSSSSQNQTTDNTSRYVAWSQADFEQNADKQRWLYFHAKWCPQCRALNIDIESNLSDIPEDVIIFKIEYDDHQDLRQRYKVLYQTTVVSVDAQGERIEAFSAGGKETLAQVIEALE